MANQVEIIVPSKKTVEAVITRAKTARALIEPSVMANAVVSQTSQAKAIIEAGANADALIRGFQGPQGAIGTAGQHGADGTISGAKGLDGAIQYKSGQLLQGARNFFYERANDIVKVSGASIVIEKGTFKIDNGSSSTGLFLVNDHNDKDVIRIDSQNQKVLFSNDYSIGVGVNSPLEQVHIAKNLRVDKTGYFGEALFVRGNPVLTGAPEQDLSSFATKTMVVTTSGVLSTKIDTASGHLDNKIDVASGHLDDKTDFLFIKTPLISGTSSQFVGFGTTLNYNPKVTATLMTRDNDKVWDGNQWNTIRYDAYTMAIYRITKSGYHADFSDDIGSTGYMIESFVSSKYFS